MLHSNCEAGKVSNVKQLTKRLQHYGKRDATGYRIDVLMDMLYHTGRTVLADDEFGSLEHAIKYAFERTTLPQYEITRKSGVRNNGEKFVIYTLYFYKD
jgi:hypothetical protein